MSFGIRPTYKNRVLVNGSVDNDDETPYNPVDTQKLIDTVLQVSRRSGGLNKMSQQDLENIIRKSSINPDFFPSMKDSVNDLYQSKREYDIENQNNMNAAVATVTPINSNTHGFSNASSSAAGNSAFRDLLDQELRRELEKVGLNGNEEKKETTTESKVNPEESEEVTRAKIEMLISDQMLANGFPARASMLRGWEFRKNGTAGGIRKTASGMIDGF